LQIINYQTKQKQINRSTNQGVEKRGRPKIQDRESPLYLELQRNRASLYIPSLSLELVAKLATDSELALLALGSGSNRVLWLAH
jgi:hypothetical protein